MGDNCKPNPEVVKIIQAMAKNRVEAGMSDPLQIIDAIHADIEPHTGLWKSEIADAITAVTGKPRELSPAAQRMRDMKAELRDLKNTQDELSGRKQNARRQKQLEKDISDLQRQMDTGDFSKAAREPYPYNEQTRKLEARREQLRQQADHEMQRIEYSNRSTFRKGLDLGHAIMRASILSGLGTLEHLAGASMWRAMAQIVGDAAEGGLRVIPAYRRLSDQALVEGGGFLAGGHAAGAKRAFSKETLTMMRDKITKGMSERAALYKDAHYTAHPLLDLIGRIHDVIKTPVEQYAYARALYRQSKNLQRTLKAAGKTDAQIEKAMLTDSAQATINARAYAKSQEAKLQGANKIAEAYQGALERLASTGDIGSAVAAVLRFETPIVKIPLNYAAESLSYMGGGLKAASDLRALKKAAKDRGVEFKLTPEQADKIVLNLKNQTVGAGLLALGWFGYEHFGGLYQAGKKQPNKDIDIGDANVGGVDVSHHLTHSPAWNVMQAGALAHYVFDADQRKAKDHGELRSALQGMGSATLAVLMDVPFSNIPKDLERLAYGGDSAGKLLGEKASQYIPAPIKEYARAKDVDAKGEPVKRKARDFTEAVKLAIPGLREEVPRAKQH